MCDVVGFGVDGADVHAERGVGGFDAVRRGGVGGAGRRGQRDELLLVVVHHGCGCGYDGAECGVVGAGVECDGGRKNFYN